MQREEHFRKRKYWASAEKSQSTYFHYTGPRLCRPTVRSAETIKGCIRKEKTSQRGN
jgi:hypothetical protein